MPNVVQRSLSGRDLILPFAMSDRATAIACVSLMNCWRIDGRAGHLRCGGTISKIGLHANELRLAAFALRFFRRSADPGRRG